MPLMTLDTDVAVPAQLSVRGQNIRERLLANGFSEERFGDDNPPATHYSLREARTAFFVEFLTPLKGSDHDRRGRRKATKRINPVAGSMEGRPRDQSNGFPCRGGGQFKWRTRQVSWRTKFWFTKSAAADSRKMSYTSTTRWRLSVRGWAICIANGRSKYGLVFTSSPCARSSADRPSSSGK